MNLYSLGKSLFTIYFKCFNRMKIIGAENIPKDRGVLICSNHFSNFDPPFLGTSCPRDVHFMAKSELFKIPVLKTVLPKVNTFPVKRGLSDRSAIRNTLNILNDGHVIGIFPEGSRNKTGKVGKGFSGAGFFALRSKADVIPCAILGSYLPFKEIKIVFGKRINFKEFQQKKPTASEATEHIMKGIQALIDERA